MEYGPYSRVALSAPWREEGSECVEVGETGKKEKQETPQRFGLEVLRI